MRVYAVSMLCWPVGQLAKFHTKRCLELQNNAAGHMTFVGMANMTAKHVPAARHMIICLVILLNSSQSSFRTSLPWKTDLLFPGMQAPSLQLISVLFNTLFLVLCLLFVINIYLFMVLFITIVCIGCLYIGIHCWIFVDVVQYVCQWICFLCEIVYWIGAVSMYLLLLLWAVCVVCFMWCIYHLL